VNWRERNRVRWLEAELPGATAVFSTRSAGSVKDDPRPLAAALGIPSEQLAAARQVHGTNLLTHPSDRKPPEGDGHVLREPGPVGLVYTADCLPVAVAGPGGAAILHCGWRGLAAGIVAEGVGAVEATHAAIGPGIGPCCYEVGEEVLSAFAGLGDGIADGRLLDLPEVANRLLREAGVTEVESAGLCTRCEEGLFFSHRRDGGPGRQAGLVWLVGEDA
jgi:purine-nucleoside/S-methyl-5'-thioadenosine phosphorylase / adenosine deaminase